MAYVEHFLYRTTVPSNRIEDWQVLRHTIRRQKLYRQTFSLWWWDIQSDHDGKKWEDMEVARHRRHHRLWVEACSRRNKWVNEWKPGDQVFISLEHVQRLSFNLRDTIVLMEYLAVFCAYHLGRAWVHREDGFVH